MRTIVGRGRSSIRLLALPPKVHGSTPFIGTFVTRKPFSFRLAASILIVAASTLLVAFEVSGQGFFGPASRSGRFIDAPRRLQQQLRDAERSLAEGEDSDAVVRLGDLLQRDPKTLDDSDLAGQDFFLQIHEAETTGRLVGDSLMRRARRMIGELRPSAMETYELRYGPLARKLLDEGQGQRDWEAVRSVRRRYFHTLAGYEASYLLAQRELLGGHALAASLLLDDVVTHPRAVEHLGEGAVEMHASAIKIAGRRDASSSVDSSPLVEGYGVDEDFSPAEVKDFAMFGGGPDRNGNSAGQMPLTNVRWDLPTTASPRQERSLRAVADDLATAGKLPPPSWMPLRVGNQLLMRTTERLIGIDFDTGKRVWTYPWFSAGVDDDRLPLDSLPGKEGPGDLLSQRVWNDLPYGQITSDGQRVFVIDDLGEVEVASFSPIGLGGTRPSDTRSNTLVALELATEGKLLWRLGAGSDQVSELSAAFFLGPPLPLDGRLYVMIELAGDINLSCLDPQTGDELWRQQLVAVESGSVDLDPIRRVSGATPTYHQGLLICPTGAGAVVTMDLSDRMLRWGLTFDRNTEMVRSVTGRGGFEATQLMQRWYSGAAVATEDTLLVTPIESDRLFGLDLLTGKRRFAEKNRVHMRYLAGARDGRFFVVGANQMRAFDLSNGASVWTTPQDLLTAGQQIVGRGVFGDGDYLLPTSSNQLIRVSLDDGRVLQRRSTRYALGNLVAIDGKIISQGASSLAVAYGEASLEPIVSELLNKDPNNFEALVRKSELLIQHGKRREALELLSRAREFEPTSDEVHLLSIAAMLGELRENPSSDGELVETLYELIERPAERGELLALRIRASLADDEFVSAIERLLELSTLASSEPLVASAADQVVGDAGRFCSLDSWLAARVNEVANEATETQLESINESVDSAIRPQLRGSDALLARFVRHFEMLQGVSEARSELANRLAAAGATLPLERLALGLQIPSAKGLRTLSVERLLILAEAYASRGLKDDALAAIEALRARSGPELAAEMDRLADMASRTEATPLWDKHVSMTWDSQPRRSPGFSISGQRIASTEVIAGKSFAHWRLVSDGSTPMTMRDATGQLRPVTMEGFDRRTDGDKEARICGSFMLILMPTELVGVDLQHVLAGDGEAVMWRRGLSGDGAPIAKRRSETTPFDDQIVRYYLTDNSSTNVLPEFRLGPVLGDRLLLLQGGDLMALDLQSKDTLWRNSTAPRSGAVLADEGAVAVVSPATNEVAFFDVLDGRRLDTTAWEFGSVWATAGTNVLCWMENEAARGVVDVRLVNPFTGDVLLQHQSLPANRTNADAPCGYGRVVAGQYLAMLNSDGEAIVWDLAGGREISRTQLPAHPDLQGLQAVLLDGQLVLLPKRRVLRARLPRTEQLQTADGRNHATVHGAHAISLDDGSLRWSQQFDTPWGCTVHQPAKTPLLMFTRSRSVFNSTGSRRKDLDALAIDVRDGRELNRTTDKTVLSTTNSLETRLTIQGGLSRVIVQIGGETLTYKFVSEPPIDAPQPKLNEDTSEVK
jgi:outer membrane protein assembly factor BamB